MKKEKIKTEEFSVSGDDVIKKIKELVKQGNIRRITIKNEKGRSIIEFPLTVGVVGAALLPVLAGIGAVVAIVTKCTIVIEKMEK